MAIDTRQNFCITDPPLPSTVHTEETSNRFDSIPTYGEVLRHSCHPEFLAIEQVYEVLDNGIGRDRAWNLRNCRSSAWFVRHDETGEVRVASMSCHLRWCPVCARARRSYITHEISEWLVSSDHPKFLTLTLKHTKATLEHQIHHLYQFFRKLRKRKDFAAAVTGGIWFFHIRKSKTDGLWHPHLHCLITGKYIPVRRIRHLWIQVTYGSEIVHIRTVNDFEKASAESARYAACPGSLAGMSLQDGIEMVEAMHGRRICGTWGTGRAVSLRPQPEQDRHHWSKVGNWQAVTGSHKTDHNAQAILMAWKLNHPLPEGIVFDPARKFELEHPKFNWEKYEIELMNEQERSPP